MHMSAGLSGFLGTLIIGPRIGRFDEEGKPVLIAGHSAALVVLGTYVMASSGGEVAFEGRLFQGRCLERIRTGA